MARCNLKVIIDGDKTRFHPGDDIHGRVEVFSEKDCKCDDLNLSFGWQTHGRGNSAGRDVHSESLFKGTWPANSQHSYPFSLTMPFGPNSYHGHLFNVDWYVEARADVPWAIDPRASQDILLDATQGGRGAYDAGPRFISSKSRQKSERQTWTSYILSMIMIVGAAIFYGVNTSRDSQHIAMAIAGLGVLIAAFIFIRRFLNNSAKNRLGNLSVKIEPRDPSPGETMRMTLMIQPDKKLKLNAITWTLSAEETVVSGSGTNRTTHSKVLGKEIIEVLPQATEIAAHSSRSFVSKTFIAPDTPCSFGANDNSLEWTLKLHIDIPRFPDWRQNYPISVLPRAGGDEHEDFAPYDKYGDDGSGE